MKRRTKTLLGTCAAVLLLGSLGVTFWMRRFPQYTPVEIVCDLQAASQVGPAPRPVEGFLELRYGPMTDPANRQKAFLDFFNIGHIKGLRLLASRIPDEHRQAHINAMALWVANYRSTMTPDEKAALGAHVRSSGGSATLRSGRFAPDKTANRMMLARQINRVPARTYGTLRRDEQGKLVLQYRPWLVLPSQGSRGRSPSHPKGWAKRPHVVSYHFDRLLALPVDTPAPACHNRAVLGEPEIRSQSIGTLLATSGQAIRKQSESISVYESE